jgi:hypothetical protein
MEKLMKKSKIQTLLDKVEKINSDMDCDTMELNEAYAELGKAVYSESLKEAECDIHIQNPCK